MVKIGMGRNELAWVVMDWYDLVWVWVWSGIDWQRVVWTGMDGMD